MLKKYATVRQGQAQSDPASVWIFNCSGVFMRLECSYIKSRSLVMFVYAVLHIDHMFKGL